MKKQNGITLVALVITIILLLILAGVTISLVLGDNGILNRTKTAGEEYTKASIKEEIELGIADIAAELASKNPTEGLTKDAIINKLPDKMKEPLSIENDLTGEYKGYEYWIDDNYVVHIGDRVSNDFTVSITVNKIGTSYFTVSTNASSNKGNIVQYIYIIDGVEKVQTTEKTHTEENLEEASKHTVKVIAIDDKGNRKTSKQTTVTTEARTYLYKEGNEYTDITGGWKNVASTGTSSKEANLMKLGVTTTNHKDWNVFGSINSIDITDYAKICVELKFDNELVVEANWYHSYIKSVIGRERFVSYDAQNIMLSTGYSTHEDMKNIKHIQEIDLSSVEAKVYVTVGFVGWTQAGFTNNCEIYNIWLEK